MNTALTPVSNTVTHRFASLAPHYALSQISCTLPIHSPCSAIRHKLWIAVWNLKTSMSVVVRIRRESAAKRFLGLRVRIPPKHMDMRLLWVLCVVRSRSPVQRSPKVCGVSECDFEASTMMRHRFVSGCSCIKKLHSTRSDSCVPRNVGRSWKLWVLNTKVDLRQHNCWHLVNKYCYIRLPFSAIDNICKQYLPLQCTHFMCVMLIRLLLWV